MQHWAEGEANAMIRACLIFSSGLMIFLLGCGPSATTDVVQIGSTKAAFLGPPTEFRALAPRLENLFGKPVVFRAQPDGDAIATQLALGEIEFAILSAKEFCEIDDASQIDLLASAVNASGQSARRALIITRKDSSIATVADLGGKRFAYGYRGDLLTDHATRATLKNEGLEASKLATEILPPPLAYGGRLYAGNDAAAKVAIPILRGDVIPISGGVIDEIEFMKLPATGGNLITGPAQDDFRVLAKTMKVPEMVVVAGPQADRARAEQLTEYLLNQVGKDAAICEQLGVTGFTQVDAEQYSLARLLLN